MHNCVKELNIFFFTKEKNPKIFIFIFLINSTMFQYFVDMRNLCTFYLWYTLCIFQFCVSVYVCKFSSGGKRGRRCILTQLQISITFLAKLNYRKRRWTKSWIRAHFHHPRDFTNIYMYTPGLISSTNIYYHLHNNGYWKHR